MSILLFRFLSSSQVLPVQCPLCCETKPLVACLSEAGRGCPRCAHTSHWKEHTSQYPILTIHEGGGAERERERCAQVPFGGVSHLDFHLVLARHIHRIGHCVSSIHVVLNLPQVFPAHSTSSTKWLYICTTHYTTLDTTTQINKQRFTLLDLLIGQ